MQNAPYQIEIYVDGYYREEIFVSLPESMGVYFVYTCTRDAVAQKVSLQQLIYIGQAENIQKRLLAHEKLEDWKKLLKGQQILCVSYAEVARKDLNRCEAALIFQHKPSTNSDFVSNFPYEKTQISIKGNTRFLTATFILEKTS